MTSPEQNAQKVDQDGNLPAALNNLTHAVTALTEPRPQLVDGRLLKQPSWYMQLWDAVSGEQSNTGGGGGSKSRPPFWTDAFDTLNEIDTAVAVWQPAYTGTPPTVGRLHTLQAHKWRPQDVRAITQITAALQAWVITIETLLNPQPKWTLPNPCPACGTTTIHRRDGAGEMVRQPALQIGPNGCTCQHCRYTWAPAYFTHLAAVLGFALPAGVLE